jgi:DNA (cytosine-5)-methyltransferase 1
VTAYYNENNREAAAWLRELIHAKVIAPGFVDERDIRDVRPCDVAGFTQCHFFAGIGVWSYALRLAGWRDNEPVWTGSCPCQPFSQAGEGNGFADERHLWPAWFHLIAQRGPGVIFGEQVASPDGLVWLDLVQADVEGENYAIWAPDICAAGFGAPHIRQRLWFVAESESFGRERRNAEPDRPLRSWAGSERYRPIGWLAHADGGHAGAEGIQRSGEQRQLAQDGSVGELGNTDGARSQRWRVSGLGPDQCIAGPASLVGRFWSDAEWLYCTDGKYRPVEPGTFPLAHGAPARVGRLRGYGNAIVAEAAAAFIAAYRETVC